MNFILDPFQQRAIDAVSTGHSVLVAAPTGAGKTLIAESAIENARAAGQTIIYTAPVKALSNQKYRDFRGQYGDEQVGILTGDVSINPTAPILIMTTEIYRNCLFEEAERIENVGWVIFDEIHYLDDVERGTVWEEAILFTPKTIKILALSATVPNIQQLAEWMRLAHERDITVIEESHRPVPLQFVFQCQGHFYTDFRGLLKSGYENRDSWRISSHERRKGWAHQYRAKPNRLDTLIENLIERRHFPAIYFVFGRRRAEYLAWEAVKYNFLRTDEKEKIVAKYQELIGHYDLTHEKTAQDLLPLIELGIAYHHAGMLPTLKEIIEQLFTSKLIKLIFTTETFALGINMPARAVIFDELEKYYGTGFRRLKTRDFYQMAGRAGRRGMDTEGHVYIRVNPQQLTCSEVKRIIEGESEHIYSQLNTAYATLLNLYKKLGPRLPEVYPNTFHCFQSQPKRRQDAEKLMARKMAMLKEMDYLTNAGLTAKGEFASSIFGYELFAGEMFADKVFDQLSVTELNMLFSSLIYEPRKGDRQPKLHLGQKKIREIAENYSHVIYRKELKYKIMPLTKLAHFNLLSTVEAWSKGAAFSDLFKWTEADEGELVRHIRMIIQLLRELMHAPQISHELRSKASKARDLINRDVVDAEKQLRA